MANEIFKTEQGRRYMVVTQGALVATALRDKPNKDASRRSQSISFPDSASFMLQAVAIKSPPTASGNGKQID